MARLAILADIHGNMPALEAVIEDLAGQRVDEVLIGGDLVGRGPQGRRVVERVRSLGWPSIGGNHEDYLLGFRHGQVPGEWLESEEWAAARWMAAELDDSAVRYIESLPFQLERPGLFLVHGTPRSNRQGIGPWTADEELEAYLAEVPAPILVCAHTHRPLDRQMAAGRVVNVGSVGLPFNRDQRAQYAIFENHGDGWQIELRGVSYDLEKIYTAYRQTGFLEHGGITARLLQLELQHASPLLVPFLEWAKVSGHPATLEVLDRFLGFYQPGEPLRKFIRRLEALRRKSG